MISFNACSFWGVAWFHSASGRRNEEMPYTDIPHSTDPAIDDYVPSYSTSKGGNLIRQISRLQDYFPSVRLIYCYYKIYISSFWLTFSC